MCSLAGLCVASGLPSSLWPRGSLLSAFLHRPIGQCASVALNCRLAGSPLACCLPGGSRPRRGYPKLSPPRACFAEPGSPAPVVPQPLCCALAPWPPHLRGLRSWPWPGWRCSFCCAWVQVSSRCLVESAEGAGEEGWKWGAACLYLIPLLAWTGPRRRRGNRSKILHSHEPQVVHLGRQ